MSANPEKEQLLEDALRRVTALRTILGLAFIACIVLSWKAWISYDRTFPTVAMVPGLPALPWFIEAILMAALIFTLVKVSRSATSAECSLVALGLCVLIGLFDQVRWQAWFCQFCLLLAVSSSTVGAITAKPYLPALAACRLIVCFTYFWSGIFKLNACFAAETLPWLLSPARISLSSDLLPFAGPACALTEALIGLSLLSQRFRTLGMFGAIMMHLGILLSIGPAGHNWNSSVWPWNFAMIGFVVLLFSRCSASTASIIDPSVPVKTLALLFCVALPALHLLGCWGAYPSFALYDGIEMQAALQFNDSAWHRLPEGIARYEVQQQQGMHIVSLMKWASDELNVSPVPEWGFFTQLSLQFANVCRNSGDVALIVKRVDAPWSTHAEFLFFDVPCRADVPALASR